MGEAKLNYSKFEESIKRLERRMDTMQKSLDLLYSDRSILEDIIGQVAHLKEIVLQNIKHQDNIKDDIKVDVKEVGDKVDSTTEDLKDKIDNKAIIKLKNRKWFSIFRRKRGEK